MRSVSDIVALLEGPGGRTYGGEPVTQREHVLQAAYRAESAGAPDWLIVAALLHDVGHLLHGAGGATPGGDRHELLGARLVAPLLGRPIARVIALHVRAKRYLCATAPGYRECLSPASLRSLAAQGGPLGPADVESFERQPYQRQAVQLRLWDDEAKKAGFPAPGLDYYRPRLEEARRRASVAD
jgi:predicted HD phosphohydrolase